jgi:hypothetical protein
MRVAVLLRGMIHSDRYVHHTGVVLNVDYRKNLDNIRTKLIDRVKEIGHIDMFLSSYECCLKDQCIQDYAPKAHVFIERGTQADCMLAGLRLIRPEEYDFVIVTRFDIDLKCDLVALDIDYEKFNVLWREQTMDHRVGDCIHMFNSRFLSALIEALDDCPIKNCLHHIMPHLAVRSEETNLLFIEVYDSNSDKVDNPVYRIMRGNVLGDLSKSFYTKFLGTKNITRLANV